MRARSPPAGRSRRNGCGSGWPRSRCTRSSRPGEVRFVRGEARHMAVTSEGRVALYLQDAHPIRDGMRYTQLAEERGFKAVWQAESRLVREATVPMAAYAAVTERIKVGSGVVNNWTRNVGLLAATFSTLDDLAPGRVILGIGAWWDPLAQKVGITRAKPL